MEYGKAVELTTMLQKIIGDNKNIVVKKSAAENEKDNFMVCARRVSFSSSILLYLIEFANDNKLEFVVRIADANVCPDEEYKPAVGEWKLGNLVAVMY